MKQDPELFKPKATATQRKVLKRMEELPESYLRPHKKPNGLEVYRLLDGHHNPVANFQRAMVSRMIGKDLVKKEGSIFKLA